MAALFDVNNHFTTVLIFISLCTKGKYDFYAISLEDSSIWIVRPLSIVPSRLHLKCYIHVFFKVKMVIQ